MLEASNSVCEAFNVVVYPSYNLGLQPVLGVDLLSFRLGSEKLLLIFVSASDRTRTTEFEQATALRCGLGTDAYR